MYTFRNFEGLLDDSECTTKTECTNDEESDPIGNNCYKKDGYLRTMLYRAWLPSCPIPPMYDITDKLYVLDHHGTWRYGSEAILRCFPGYELAGVPYNSSHPSYPDYVSNCLLVL